MERTSVGVAHMSSASSSAGKGALTLSKRLKRKLEDSVSSEQQKKAKPFPDDAPSRIASRRCDFTFFDRPCEELAKNLLGCSLHSRRTTTPEGEEEEQGSAAHCWGRIVETEAYLGGDDKASHSFNGRRTQRNEAMYMPPGTAYVYSIYGMHHCFNISSRGSGAAVLVRALQPLGGMASMSQRRKCTGTKKDNKKDLCSGPAKLCQALAIDRKTCDRLNLTSTSPALWVEHPAEAEGEEEGACPWTDVVESGRIGVQYAEEWAAKPLRYHFKDCPYISKR